MKLGFDVISDLNLVREDEFNWEDKATSLYLIIAGNISGDIHVIQRTLLHLSNFYQGIFYIPGSLEYETMHLFKHRTDELRQIADSIHNVALLHKHVVIINDIALLGVNGWYGVEHPDEDNFAKIYRHAQNIEDLGYLKASIQRLQLHLDVKKVVVVTNSTPGPKLYFGETPNNLEEEFPLQDALATDLECKITHWVFGTYNKQVDTILDSIHYVNNVPSKNVPYWPKKIEV